MQTLPLSVLPGLLLLHLACSCSSISNGDISLCRAHVRSEHVCAPGCTCVGCVLLPVSLGMENQSFTRNFASALATTLKLPVSASPANLWAPCRWSCVLIIFAPSVPTESFLLNHMTRHKAWDKTPRESRCFSGPRSISHVSSSL